MAIPESLPDAYDVVRATTERLCEPLQIEDFGVQPMLDASPPRWHLAHVTWFFETFILKPWVPGYEPFDPAYEVLFNSYYNGVGEQFPRAERGRLSRPTVREVLDYRRHVDAAIHAFMEAGGLARHPTEAAARLVLGLHHEQQHQELLITDIKANFGTNPLDPPYRRAHDPDAASGAATVAPLTFSAIDGGLIEVGHTAPERVERFDAFAFDNESPRHRVHLEPFRIADRPVTNGEYLSFMADGGYDNPALWLADGWARVREAGWRAPEYWRFDDRDGWTHYTMSGRRAPRSDEPVTHVSFHEAAAFAAWAGWRLPTEFEWEAASARASRANPNLASTARFHPEPVQAGRLRQLFGDAWEWTASSYAPYPGFRPFAGALGEYNGKFMSSQMVLRGGSCATPAGHLRSTYRNFFYPPDRWQFTTIRLAGDA